MVTVLSIIGTRPEAIKMAPVIRALARRPREAQSLICAAGQHREMLEQALTLFDITPDFQLDVMQDNQELSRLTAALLAGLAPVIERVRPHWILAQGDTTTAMAAAMLSFYHRIPFGHVEAGLRTGNIRAPFPEEVNRRIADMLASLHFAPTELARQALLREGVPDDVIHVTGNTVVDAVLEVSARPCDWTASPLARLPRNGRIVLITAHRRESFGEPLRQLCLALRDLGMRYGQHGVHFVYPVHLNPQVRRPVNEILADLPNVSLLEPLDYLSFVHLMKRSALVLTDSGGIQEEAPGLGVPVLVMRETTERPEGLATGLVKLVGTRRDRIVAEAARWLDAGSRPAGDGGSPYGDGRAAERIASILLAADSRRRRFIQVPTEHAC